MHILYRPNTYTAPSLESFGCAGGLISLSIYAYMYVYAYVCMYRCLVLSMCRHTHTLIYTAPSFESLGCMAGGSGAGVWSASANIYLYMYRVNPRRICIYEYKPQRRWSRSVALGGQYIYRCICMHMYICI